MANDAAKTSPRPLYIAAGYCLLFLGFIGLAVIPYVRTMAVTKGDVDRLDQEIADRIERGRQLDDLRHRVELVDLQTRNYDRLVPVNQDSGPFLTELTRELEAAGMHDTSYGLLPSTPLGKSQRTPVEIHGKGTFAQFHDFLVRLENLKRLSSVGKLSIDTDADMNGEVTVQITLFIYNTKSGS